MKSIRHKLRHSGVTVVLLLLSFLFLGMVGCMSGAGKSAKFKVTAFSNQQVAALSSDDVVRIMRRAGFSNEQILQMGTQLRNGLLLSGAAQISRGNVVEAIFAVNNNNVYIAARLRGNFIYDPQKGNWIRLGRPSPQSQPKQAPAATLPGKHPQSALQILRDRQTRNAWQR